MLQIKSVAFLHKNDNYTEKEIRKTASFIISLK